MSAAKSGGPAFPTNFEDESGMTMRDYFAVHASEADVLAQAEVIRELMTQRGDLGILADGWRVKARYMHADEMLKERGQ